MIQRVTSLERPVDLSGRTALVIGATAGIGASVAAQFAAMGATTLIVGRDPAKLQHSLNTLSAIAPGRVHAEQSDLADLASVDRAATALCAAYPRIDIVVANASVLYGGRRRGFTADGFEASFGINHLGNAAMLLGLERPIRTAQGRVVIVASEAHRRARGLPLDDLMGERGFQGNRAYNRSKLANILFARELARRWPEVTVHAAHPGGVLTDMFRGLVAANRFYRLMFGLIRSGLLTPDQAAAGIVRVAVDVGLDQPSGGYFELGSPAKSSATAMDAELGRRLYDATVAAIRGREWPTSIG